MKQKLFNNDIIPKCEYCLHGKLAPGGEEILCIKMGIMSLSSSCKKYKYDPLKRQPKKMPQLPQFEKKDFEL